jgi:hypothetical protein
MDARKGMDVLIDHFKPIEISIQEVKR